MDYAAIQRGREYDKEALGLCLSGGGLRAMLFHLGVVERLLERGVLLQVKYLDTVSGGSILGAWLALHWERLEAAPPETRQAFFEKKIAQPLLRCAEADLRNRVLRRWLLPCGAIRARAEHLADVLDEHLFQGARLGDLPSESSLGFCINSTNLRSGKRFGFNRGFIGDYLSGYITQGVRNIRIATAVAASSAYPLLMGPLILKVPRDVALVKYAFTQLPPSLVSAEMPPNREISLMDGGVYANLGVRATSDRCGRVIAVDAGLPLDLQYQARKGAMQAAFRSVDVLMSRTVQLPVETFHRALIAPPTQKEHRKGLFIRISQTVQHQATRPLPGAPGISLEDVSPGLEKQDVTLLSQLRTDMERFGAREAELLRYHGQTLLDVNLSRFHPEWGREGAPIAPQEVTADDRKLLQEGKLHRLSPVVEFWNGI